MKRETLVTLGVIGVVGMIIVCISTLCVLPVLWLASYTCHAQWERSGLNVEWGLVSGCMVQRRDGTWVPADAVRELTL